MSFIYEPERAYEFVKSYLTPEHKKECCSMVYIALSFLYYNSDQHVYYLKYELPIESGFQSYAMTINSLIGNKIEEKKTLNLKLDLRLVELILDEKKEFTILDRLFDKGNEELFPLYQSHYKKMADKGENYVYLKGLQKCGNTDWKGIFCSYIKNHSGHLYSLILKIYIQLPIKIEEKIEELKQALKIIEEKKANSELYYYALDSSLKQEIKDAITKLEKRK